MESSPKLTFLVFVFSTALTFVQSGNVLEKLYEFCPSNNTFAPNSTYGLNLNDLFTSLALSDTEIENGFFNVSYGEKPDQVNAVGLCRGDVSPNVCHSCIYETIGALSELCPDQAEAIVWYDQCMFRYSNRSIFGKMEFQPSHQLITADDLSKLTKLDEILLTTLLDNLQTQAASGDSLRKFATGSAPGSKGQTMYALAQCTPDLSGPECKVCLSKAAESLLESGVEAARSMTPSCSIRYANYLLYDKVDLPPQSPPSDAPALPPEAPSPSPPVSAPPPSPPVDEPPPPPVSDEPPPLPPFFDEPPPSPPVDEDPPPWEFDAPPPAPLPAPEPPVELPDDGHDAGKGNMNSRIQALATVVPLVILQFYVFLSPF